MERDEITDYLLPGRAIDALAFYRPFALALIGKERSEELPELVSSASESKWVVPKRSRVASCVHSAVERSFKI